MSRGELIYGYHAIKAVMATQPNRIMKLYLQENREDQRLQTLLQQATQSGITIVRLPRHQIDQLIGTKVQHQGLLAECKDFPSFNESALPSLVADQSQPILLLVLDGVQDPHNLGACIRSANAFGVHAVIAPKDRAVGLTPVVRKIASGATVMTPFVQVTNLVRTLRDLQQQGVWIVGMVEKGDLILNQVDLKGNIAIVMGAEGAGLRRLTQECCDYLANIPMQGTVGSLNVSVAAAIALYEVQRQRA